MIITDHAVYIVPGFGEGLWHIHQLLPALQKLGYFPVSSVKDADIVITHSAGCNYIPRNLTGKRVIMIGPSYWPGKPLIYSFIRKESRYLAAAVKRRVTGYWLKKVAWNLVYIVRTLPLAVRRGTSAERFDFGQLLNSNDCSVIRAEHDEFCSPKIDELLSGYGPVRVLHAPGQHDDCWFYTGEYARVIDQAVRS